MTRLESIRDNTFLLGLDMNRATKEQKIQWLCQIIDNETEKPEDEIDFALIDECSAYLRELSGKEAEATQEQKTRILQQIKAHHNQTATGSAKELRPNWRKAGKIVAIAAMVAALLISTLTVIAKVSGYSSAWEYVKENIQKVLGLDAGDRVNDGGITLIKNDDVVAYHSIEELLESEGLDILYPAELPDGVRITKISQQVVSNEEIVYCYQFTDETIFIMASTVSRVSQEKLERYEKIPNDSISAYLIEKESGECQIVGYDDKYEYRIYGSEYDVLMEILKGMKGIGR